MSTRIPKRIVQTAKSFNLPLLYKSATANVQLLNPDFESSSLMKRKVPRLFHADFFVLNTTGPGLLSRTLPENPRIGDDVTVLFPDG